LPRLFLPMKTIADGELHDGGSTSFTLIFLPEMEWCSACPAGDGGVRLMMFGWLSSAGSLL